MEAYIEYFNKNYDVNTIEELLLGLRAMGASQIETIRVLRSELKLSLPEADKIVLNSEAWNDMKEATIQLRENIWEALNSLED
ncbi:hypothetical protein [Emticicia agri]|uniref:Uncharacterized protein n=1 Tax=Emticicia agri TaxID=2492393 RepID=A0A4Q5LQL2_9BACT|nr:hypothetical protein [Emticicia agri]RYU91771.1 hypothetical protein EWM59_26860 [Emticicia agri]